jgi:hypothetical protein
MAIIFYLLGWLCIVSGGFYTWVLITGGAQPPDQPGAALSNVMLVSLAQPGLTVMMGGLILLALGGALSRLDRIARNTALSTAPPTSRRVTDWEPRDREPRL